jgi:hypothetical protein
MQRLFACDFSCAAVQQSRPRGRGRCDVVTNEQMRNQTYTQEPAIARVYFTGSTRMAAWFVHLFTGICVHDPHRPLVSSRVVHQGYLETIFTVWYCLCRPRYNSCVPSTFSIHVFTCRCARGVYSRQHPTSRKQSRWLHFFLQLPFACTSAACDAVVSLDSLILWVQACRGLHSPLVHTCIFQ